MDAIPVVSDTILGITRFEQLLALFIVCALIGVMWWSHKRVIRCERLEEERTKVRKMERDKQLAEMDERIKEAYREATGVGASIDKHREKYDTDCREIFSRLSVIEKNQIDKGEFQALQREVRSIEHKVVEIHTIVKERFK